MNFTNNNAFFCIGNFPDLLYLTLKLLTKAGQLTMQVKVLLSTTALIYSTTNFLFTIATQQLRGEKKLLNVTSVNINFKSELVWLL